MDLELRICPGDGREFKVWKSSSQEFCSKHCEEIHRGIPREKWVGQKKAKLAGEQRQESAIESVTPKIQNTGARSLKPESGVGRKKSNTSEHSRENVTIETKKKETKGELNGLATTGSDKMLITEKTMLPAAIPENKPSTLAASAEIPPEDSKESLKSFSEEISRSINSLNSVESELLNSMKGLRTSQPDQALRLYDPERITTAVLCGRQIVEGMKTKIELIKLGEALKKSKEGL